MLGIGIITLTIIIGLVEEDRIKQSGMTAFFMFYNIYKEICDYRFMAKLLTIGCAYHPNEKVKNPDGTSSKVSLLDIYFNCDARTASLIHGSGVVKGVHVDGDSLVKTIMADKYKDFIYGKKAFPTIISEFEKYGYVFDMSKLDELNDSIEQTINNFAQSGIQTKINNDVYAFIEQLLDAMEKNMNDPNFMAFLDSIGAIKKFVGNDNLDDLLELTPENKLMILTQWLASGHQGSPTYVATKKQFKEGGYVVNPNATPLYFVYRTDAVKRSRKKTLSDIGATQADWDSDDLLKVQVAKLQNDKDFGNNNAKSFRVGEPYYDISECTPFRQSNLMDKILARDSAKNINRDLDKDANLKKKSDVIANIQTINQNILDNNTMCQNAKAYADKIGDKKLARVASSGIASQVVKFLADNAEAYLRNAAQRNSGQHTRQTRDLLEALALKKLGLGSQDVDRIIVQNCNFLRRNGKVNKDMFITVASDLENIYYIMSNNLNESVVSNDMLKFVLDSCGVSVEEFKNMPQNEMEANEMVNDVRESFIRTFNKLLIAH